MAQKFDHYINAQGQITQWPARQQLKYAVLSYMAMQFEPQRNYTEREVNEILQQRHTFNDYFILRRSLIEGGWLMRTRNGAQYWKSPQQPAQSELLEDYLREKKDSPSP